MIPDIATSVQLGQNLAFDHRILVLGLTEVTRSLEDSLLAMTGASAEYVSA